MFIGDDWAEDHHDVELQDETGRKLASAQLPEGVEGIAKLHTLIARHGGEDLESEKVAVGIETDRGPWVQALIAAGYRVYVGPRATRATHTRSQIWSASTAPSCGPLQATATRPRPSAWSLAPTRP